MSRFFFHVHVGDEVSIDDEGFEYPSVEIATAEALKVITHTAETMIGEGLSVEGIHIEVSDEHGNLVSLVGDVGLDPIEGQTLQ